MVRVDPEVVLKTLAPLLGPCGSIKSNNEVDKIYGLMSRFAKKQVNKCTYINILKATQRDTLDLFLQRGGWDMILDWTNDAISKNNYEMLKEIFLLLLYAPATIQRLKENELPKVVKSIAKGCENEEVKRLAIDIVAKWLAIAKQQQQNPLAMSSTVNVNSISSNPQSASTQVVMQPMVQNVSSVAQDNHNNHNEMDLSSFDIAQMDLNNMDFNPDDFSKVVDQHLSDAITGGNAVVQSVDNANVTVDDTSDSIKIDLTNVTDARSQTVSIKNLNPASMAIQHENVKPETVSSPYCLVEKDGKKYLVKLTLASAEQVAKLQNVQEVKVKVKPPEKEGSNSKDGDKEKQKQNADIMKTYSKKNPVVAKNGSAEDSKLKSSKSKSSSDKSDSVKKHRSSSKSSSSVAAKKAEEEQNRKLQDKIRHEKEKLKRKLKEEQRRKKQEEKDKETLRALNLDREPSVTSAPGSKLPKIAKRQPASFADAIGIPGSSEVEKEKTVKRKSSSAENDVPKDTKSSSKSDSSSNGIKEKDKDKDKGKDKDKERRNRVKVFQSKTNRGEELLKAMTESESKSSKSNKSDNSKSNDSGLTGEKSLTANLISKGEKRPSLDGIEKSETKKPKIGDDSDKKKDKQQSSKEKKPVTPTSVIKESSLFMDTLNASFDKKAASKPKRKNSISSQDKTKDKDIKPKINELNSSSTKAPEKTSSQEESVTPKPTSPPPEAVKPVFNFYRETLDDNDKDDSESGSKEEEPMDTSISEEHSKDTPPPSSPTNDDEIIPEEIPQGPLKGVLVIVRSKDKPKKSVRFREEEKLTEVFTFELDEDERINVTRPRDFREMKEHEKAEEKQFITQSLKHRMDQAEADDRMLWRRLIPFVDTGIPEVCVRSREKFIQEERERVNLGVFLPPGSILPDSPSEPDPASPSDDVEECRPIPMEDVANVTKLYDNTYLPWPKPHLDMISGFRPGNNPLPAAPFGSASILGDLGAAAQQLSGYSTASQSQIDMGNPWNIGTGAGPIGNVNFPINFQQPPPAIPNAFGFVPPTIPTLPNAFAPPFNLPGVVGQGLISNPNSLARNAANVANPGNPNRTGVRGNDFGDRDFRKNFNRDRDSRQERGRGNFRSRDYDRNRGRDRRSPSPRRRRDERGDKDYRDHDYRSRQQRGKRDVLCRFFTKGQCNQGSRCEFSHDLNNHSDKSGSRTESSSVPNGPASPDAWEDDNNQYERRNPTGATPIVDLVDTPSSPTNEIPMDSAVLPAKIIPVE